MNQLFGLNGISYTQAVSDYLAIVIALVMLITSVKKTFPTEKHSVRVEHDTNLSNKYEVVE